MLKNKQKYNQVQTPQMKLKIYKWRKAKRKTSIKRIVKEK